ncbi:Microfibrillar-associated protein 1 [Rhizoclosmatium hyalinum]|nr:Microfibrillar-associated protein 1 [Rhizoclosmatium hyalinum]
MTDAEIQAENEKLNPKKEEKKQLKFMQKYYHKGAFFTDEEIVATRDFNEPTLEDKFDKTILPAVMQVKNFGKSGQTKWTHLSKEDTSNRDSAWFQDSDVNKRTLAKMAGMKQSYEKPTARKKSKIE